MGDLSGGMGDMSGGMPDATGLGGGMAGAAPVSAFTSPNKFTQAQRESFKRVATSMGIPKEYVDAMCGQTPVVLSKKVAALNSKIKEVYASNMSEATKNQFITKLVKEASLSPDSKSEFIRYWNDVLGYQDKEFWPEVAADYDEDGKKKGK